MSRFGRELKNFRLATIGYRNTDFPVLGIIIANTLNGLLGTGEECSGNNEEHIVSEASWGVSFSAVSVEYETENRHYTHKEFLSDAEQVKNMILQEIDGAILVIDAQRGITSDIKNQLHVAQMAGVQYLTVFVDNCDMIDEEQTWELGDEIRELLDSYEYCGDDTPIVYGSAKGAWEDFESEWGENILELMEMVDEYMPDPERDIDKDFLMSVEDVFSITGRGTVACGRVESGIVKLNDRVKIVGLRENEISAIVTGIEMFRKLMDSAEVGDNIGLLLRGLDRNEIKRGQVITRMGTWKAYSKFMAVVHFVEKEIFAAVDGETELYFWFRVAEFPGTISFSKDEMNDEGQYAEVTVKLSDSVAMNIGQFFAIKNKARKIIGIGKVTKTV